MDLIAKELGAEGSVKVVIEAGKIGLVLAYDSKGLDGSALMSVDSDYFIDKLAEKIPGHLDDAILVVLKTALKSL